MRARFAGGAAVRRTAGALMAGALLAAGCTRDAWQRSPGPDDVVALVPWFANMSSDISVKPYKAAPRMPVEGTVPVTGAEKKIPILRLLPTPQNVADLGREYPNPVPVTAQSVERGRDRYGIYCTPCHGDSGAGDGPISAAYPGFPSIVAPGPQGYSDGFLYALIKEGRGFMPEYGSRLRADDRWHVVNYLRVLQGTAR